MELFKFIRLGIIFIGVGLSNCSTPGEYKIQGTATGIGQGMVCIISYLDKKADTLAKAEIKEEKFELKAKVSNLTISTLQIPGKGIGHAPIYLENTDYTVRLNPQNLEMSEIIGGGESQKIAHGLFLIDQNLSQAIDSIRDEYIKEANNPQSTRFQELNTFLDSIQQTIEKQKEAFLQKNATTYVALNHIAQNADRMNLKELTERYELFPAELQNSLLGQQIKTQIKKMQTLAPGQIAPDFTVQTPDGKSFNLHSIKAKAKIIDFWASWCAPCRALTPQLVKLYNEFHEQGLEIIGISLDDKKEAWIKAIEEENIPWFQGSKLDGFKPDNPLNQLYGIHGIPHIVLLNTDNQIVVTTTDIKILREEILKLFKQ